MDGINSTNVDEHIFGTFTTIFLTQMYEHSIFFHVWWPLSICAIDIRIRYLLHWTIHAKDIFLDNIHKVWNPSLINKYRNLPKCYHRFVFHTKWTPFVQILFCFNLNTICIVKLQQSRFLTAFILFYNEWKKLYVMFNFMHITCIACYEQLQKTPRNMLDTERFFRYL